jgi:hypothetical protein
MIAGTTPFLFKKKNIIDEIYLKKIVIFLILNLLFIIN